MSDKPSFTYYPTVTYDIKDIRISYVIELMNQLVTKEANSSVIEVDVEGHPGVKAYAAGDGQLRAPSDAVLKVFDEKTKKVAAGLLGDVDGIRQLFADGNTNMLLSQAKSENRSMSECSDILNSLEAGLVDEIRIVDGDTILVSLQEGEWS